MLGSGIHTVCDCHSCCPNKFDGLKADVDLLPDQIHFSYSGVPSFIQPPLEWDTTNIVRNPNSSNTLSELKNKGRRFRSNPSLVVEWSGVIDRLIDVNGNKTKEYFKFFPEGNRPSFTISGTDSLDVDQWRQTAPFGPWIKENVQISTPFSKHFEIVGVYVAQIAVAKTEANQPASEFDNVYRNDYISDNGAETVTFQVDISQDPRIAIKNCNCPTNNCCLQHGSPGCGSYFCTEEIKNHPDYPNNVLCTGSNGSCYIARSTPCCDQPFCSTAVCTTPGFEYCCEPIEDGGIWDSGCVQKAAELCDNLCGMNECQQAVCTQDPFCCDKNWDNQCVERAEQIAACNCTNIRWGDRRRNIPIDIGYAWFADIIIEFKDPLNEGFYGTPIFRPVGWEEYGNSLYSTIYNYETGIEAVTILSPDFIAKRVNINDPYYRFTSVKAGFSINNSQIVTLENFYTTPDASKRQTYLVPSFVEEYTKCALSPGMTRWYNPSGPEPPRLDGGFTMPFKFGYIEPFAREIVDFDSTIDPCHSDIIPVSYPSSPIRNNKHPLTIQYTGDNLQLPYGVYNLNVAETSELKKQGVCIGGDELDPRSCPNITTLPPDGCGEIRENGCLFTSVYPGCPCNTECEQAVCSIPGYSHCCQTNPGSRRQEYRRWGEECRMKALELGAICQPTEPPTCANGESCFEVHEAPGCGDSPGCCKTVCSILPFCCEPTNGWSQECVTIAETWCALGSTSLPYVCSPTVPIFQPKRNLFTDYYNEVENKILSDCGPVDIVGDPYRGIVSIYRNSCGFKYECVDPIIIPEVMGRPGREIRESGNPNFGCGYDYIKSPGCLLSERPIDSMFLTSFIPENPCIIYYTDGDSCGTEFVYGQKYCYRYDNSGEILKEGIDNMQPGSANEFIGFNPEKCPLPATNFPKLRRNFYSPWSQTVWNQTVTSEIAQLFASSTTIIISPVNTTPSA